jgi:hypothetical protein
MDCDCADDFTCSEHRPVRIFNHELYHGLTYDQHRALMIQRTDGSWWCPNCEEALAGNK